MLQVDSVTVSVLVDNTTDMLSTRPPRVASELRVLIAAGMRELTGEGLCSGPPRALASGHRPSR